MKKIITILTTLSIVLSMFAAMVHAEDTIWSIYPKDETPVSKTYTPDATGFYYIYFDISINKDIFEGNTIPLQVYNTSDNTEIDYIFDHTYLKNSDWIGHVNYYYYLESGKTYSFNYTLPTYDRTYLAGIKLYKKEITNAGELKTGESGALSFTKSNYYYLSFIPEKDGNLMIDFSSESNYAAADCHFYSTSTGKTTNFAENQLVAEVSKGKQCIMVIDYNEGFDTFTYNFDVSYLKNADNTPIVSNNVIDFQTEHPYESFLDKTWTYEASEDTKFIEIIFDGESCIGKGDTLSIYDGDGQVLYSYSDQSIANEQIMIEGNSFSLKMVSDLKNSGYGFALTEINAYTEFPVPKINRTTGKTRPFRAILTAPNGADIYYKISGSGDYELYTEPFVVESECIVCAYMVKGNYVSDKAFYYFEMDYSTPTPPVIETVEESEDEIVLSFSAEDGIVYYKRVFADEDFIEYIPGTTVKINEEDVIEAYALCGNVKSESVFMDCDIYDNDKHYSQEPTISITPVLGGKKITLDVPWDISFGTVHSQEGCVDSHLPSQCTLPESKYLHDSFWFDRTEDISLVLNSVKKDGTLKELEYTRNSDIPVTVTVTEDTSFIAKVKQNVYEESGAWVEYMDENGTPISHSREYNEPVFSEYESNAFALHVEVPQAKSPVIKASLGSVSISADDGLTVYYSVDGSEYEEYTGKFAAQNGSVVKAYTMGLGVLKSEETVYTVNFNSGTTGVSQMTGVTSEFTSVPTVGASSVNNISINLKSLSAISSATLILAAFDTEKNTLAGISINDISLKTGNNLLENLTVKLGKSCEHVYLKAFVWDKMDSQKPYGADTLLIL